MVSRNFQETAAASIQGKEISEMQPGFKNEAQRQHSAADRFSRDYAAKHGLSTDLQQQIRELHIGLTTELLKSGVSDFSKAVRDLEYNFKQIAQNNNCKTLNNILQSFCKISLSQQELPAEFEPIKNRIVIDLVTELSNPLKEIDQGMSNACAITARRYIAAHPDLHAEFVASIVCKGYGYTGRSETGASYGFFSYKPGMFSLEELNSRSLGSAIYQSVLLKTLGSPAEGLMPIDIERFAQARGQICRIYTFNEEVSSTPDKTDDVLNAVLACAKAGKTGLLSLEFANSGSHCKHILELCPQDGVPSGYVRLSNPWDVNEKLPERYQKMVINNNDGTFMMKIEDLKQNLYFAVLETGNEADIGITAGAKVGYYRSQASSANPDLSYYGCSLTEAIKKYSRQSEVSHSVRIARDSAKAADRLPQTDYRRSEAKLHPVNTDYEGSKYFASLALKN